MLCCYFVTLFKWLWGNSERRRTYPWSRDRGRNNRMFAAWGNQLQAKGRRYGRGPLSPVSVKVDQGVVLIYLHHFDCKRVHLIHNSTITARSNLSECPPVLRPHTDCLWVVSCRWQQTEGRWWFLTPWGDEVYSLTPVESFSGPSVATYIIRLSIRHHRSSTTMAITDFLADSDITAAINACKGQEMRMAIREDEKILLVRASFFCVCDWKFYWPGVFLFLVVSERFFQPKDVF